MHWIGTAGWSVPADAEKLGTHLYRYSRIFSCVEINSSFYRSHRAATWARWSQETPSSFRFSIKAPKAITHERKLRNAADLLEAFFEQIEPMGQKTGPILFQLPPSLSFDLEVAEDFFSSLRRLYKGEVVLEPRHRTWFTASVNAILKNLTITRAAADPAKADPVAAEPGGDTGLAYYRLHGTPNTYYSKYEDDFLIALASRIKLRGNVWVVFDNTALSYAYSNALQLQALDRESLDI
ncbi:DUF72 domain-containing protein [Acidobacterium sp. S8]|uniref:DUF72 domain-containing protein n=1 Tax=Acidobacterium sp. S8 TaxID=1641854 RepID=UPI00131E74AC|nr:DUF72 domain-containing protein [Acidobacterium sp. S8]